MLSVTVINVPPAVAGAAGTDFSVDLSNYVDDPAIDTQVRFKTDLGDIDLQLFDSEKPISVANFLKYVREGRYDGTIVHRVTKLETDGLAVIQGGGFGPFLRTGPEDEPQHIPTDAPIQNEAAVAPILSNLRGTIAYARTSDPNSATSEWFINTADNSAALDVGSSSNPDGFAVFGEVINNTIGVADTIQQLPVFQLGGALQATPLRNVTPQQQQALVENFIRLTAGTLPKLTYQVSSSNPSVVTPTVVDNALRLQYGPSTGTADVTVISTDAQGQSVTQTFTATATEAPQLAVTLGGTSGAQSVTFTDADGTASTVSLRGPGTATVTLDGTGLTQATNRGRVTVTGAPAGITSVAITGASAATALTVNGRGGNGVVNLGGLTSDAALKSLAGKPAALTGALSVTGAVGKLDLGNTTNATITLGGAATDKPGVVTLGDAAGTAITSSAPLKSVTATSFAAGQSGRATIAAPALDALTARGDMTQDVDVAGAIKKVAVGGNMASSIEADTIGSVAVKGGMSDSTVISTRAFSAAEKPIGKVTVGGAASNVTVRANGNITSVTAGSFNAATIYAGIAESVNPVTLPTTTAQFASQASIGSVTSKSTSADTNVAASKVGKLNLGTVTTANNGTPFGVAGDQVASLRATIGSTRANFKKLETQEDVTAQAAGLTLEDLDINVV
jgi:cyclophilin family peptidyl-prolyl cis-trans isomerase